MVEDNKNKKKKEQLDLLAKRIKRIRNLLDLTQVEFARKIDTASGYLSEIEKGKSNPGFLLLINISNIFNVNINYLFFGEGDIFGRGKEREEEALVISKGRFGEDIENIVEMLDYFEKSPLVKHSLLGIFVKFIYENSEFIKMDMEKNEKKKEHDEAGER